MRAYIPFECHRKGFNCGSAPIRDLFEFYGLPLTETLAFGIGSGLYFIYNWGDDRVVNPQWKSPYVSIVGRHWTPHVELCSVLGAKLTVDRTDDHDRAWREVKALVDAGVPVLCTVAHDTFAPLLGRSINPITEKYGWYFGEHRTIMIGYDEEQNEAYLLENMLTGVTTIPLDAFHASRRTEGYYKPMNEWAWLEAPRSYMPLGVACKIALRKTQQLMTNPSWEWAGLSGLDVMAAEIADWPSLLTGPQLEAGVVMAEFQDTILGGGGYHRRMFSNFLREAARLTGESPLNDLSGHYRDLSDEWTQFTERLKHAYRTGLRADWEAVGAQVRTVRDREYAGMEKLSALTARWF